MWPKRRKEGRKAEEEDCPKEEGRKQRLQETSKGGRLIIMCDRAITTDIRGT